MDRTETYIKMSDCEEIQEYRTDRKYPEFPHKSVLAGDLFIVRDPNTLIFEMTGDDSPPKHLFINYILGSEQVSGTNIPEKEQYLDFKGRYKTFKDPLRELIWLPYQHQLQAMYLRDMPDGTYQKVATLAEVFHDYHKASGYPSYAFSMEQLWLAFVMSEKYNKKWDGEKWN